MVALSVLVGGLILSATPVSAAGCFSAPAGLVSWWPADGNASDIAGTNNGTLQGGATALAAGMVGTAFNFDGTNGFVQVPDSPSLRPTNLTVEAWVKFSSLNSAGNAAAGSQFIIFKQNSRSSSFEGYELGKVRGASGDTFTFVVTSSGGQSAFVNSSTLISTGVWYHVAGVRGTNFLQVYVNGQMQSQTNVSFAQNYGTLPLYLGTSGQASFDRKFAGTLDEVSLYNRALSSNEVAAIYVAGAAGKCKGVSITVQPQSQTVSPGSNVTFTVTATGFGVLRYQWRFNGSAITGATNTSLTLTNVQLANAGGYSVTVSNSLGPLTSATATLTVVAPPSITTPPQSQTVLVGANVSLNVLASGTPPLVYQWRLNGSAIGSATSANLTLTNVQPSDAGSYVVVVSNAGGSITSTPPATLVVNVPPSITSQPQSLTVLVGDSAGFNVTATGTVPLNYQWLFNGNAIGTATSPSLTLANVQPADAGSYAVVVSNAGGSVTSAPPALLTVIASNVVTIPDPNLEVVVRVTLAKPAGYLTQSDLQSLTSLSGPYRNITNLSGLEWAVNLKGLYLSGNAISNLIPLANSMGLASLELDHNLVRNLSPLSGLTNLTALSAGANPMTDYSTVSGLTNLTRLSLYQGAITNLNFLQSLKSLTALTLYDNNFVDISALTQLTNLSSLDLRWNAINDCTLLSTCTNLTRLYLGSDSVTNLEFLQSLTQLTFLDVDNNGITDLTVLSALTNLTRLVLSGNPGITNPGVVSGLTGLLDLEFRASSISNLSFISGLKQLKSADLANNGITDVSPLAALTNLNSVNLSGNPTTNFVPGLAGPASLWLFHHSISNVTFLAGLSQLTALGLDDNQVGDPSPLLSLTNLQYLGLSQNPITDLGILSGLTNLTGLWFEGNTCSNLGGAPGLNSLKNLSLRNNRFTSLAGLAGLTNLNALYAGTNRLTDISVLTNLTRLSRVELSHNLLDVRPGTPAWGVVQILQSRGVEVDYLPTNQPPVIAVPQVFYVAANQTSSLSFYLSDALVSPGELTMTVTSSNPSLIPNGGIAVSNSTNTTRVVTMIPATNQVGTTVITLTASQPPGGLSISTNLLVNVMYPSNVVIQPYLADAVLSSLGLAEGNLTSVQMMSLTNLYAYYAGVSDVSGLQWASNLTVLYLSGNSIASVTPLQNLKNLTYLNLYNNFISDVAPLAGLTNLAVLDLSWNPVTNLATLAGLTNLTSLFLAGDSVGNLGFLTNLPRLAVLDLSFNKLSNISALSGLTNLTSLYLQQNRLTGIAPLNSTLAPSSFVDLSLNLLPAGAVDPLLNKDVLVNFLPQRTPPFVDVRTNWLVSPNSTSALTFSIWDTGPSAESLNAGANASNPDLGVNLVPPPGQVANGSWALVLSNQLPANTQRTVTISATNDVGYTASTKVVIQITPLVPVTGSWFGDPSLTWSSGGDASWFGQGLISDAGFPAAQSGVLANGQSSWLHMDVPGPGRLTFWWKISSESGYDSLQFSVADYTNSISGEVDWQPQTVAVPSGSQSLDWVYHKDNGGSGGYDAAWLSRVSFVPGIWLELLGKVTNSQCNLLLHAVPGNSYQVQISTNLINWSSLAVVVPTNSAMPFVDTNAVTRTRFYRLYSVPLNGVWLDSPGFTNGLFRFSVHSAANQRLNILASPSLTNWSPIGNVTNVLGTTPYVDLQSTGFPLRFYRATVLP